MIRSVIAACLSCFILAGNVSAQSCSVPNTLANGSNADATQVMANFNAILACLNNQPAQGVPRGYLSGLTLTASGGSPAFSVAVGAATSDDTTTLMNLPLSISKTTGAWAVGSNNGALDTGTILSSTWYHVFEIERVDAPNVNVDILISRDPTSPTMPANYTKKRRIGSMKTNGSSQWIAFIQTGGRFIWSTAVPEINTTTLGTTPTAFTLLGVPTGVKTVAFMRGFMNDALASTDIIITSTDEAASAPDNVVGNRGASVSVANISQAFQLDVQADTSAQVRAASSNPGNTTLLKAAVYGYFDFRGQ